MRTILRGTEADTLELDGTLAAPPPIPAPLELADEPARVNLLLFAMRGLALRAVPWPRFDYHEALWRIAVRIRGEPGWLAVACDLDSATIRAFGRRVVRYPTRVARFGERWSVDAGGGSLIARVTELADSPPAQPARRTFVRDRDRLYEIPWQEIAAPERRTAAIDVVTDTLSRPTFGDSPAWARSGLVHRGRIHMCGVARAVV
ncbi:MAG TPA: hypothetical protein VLX92_03475 [Kofleriaceae bacterium]|nr:hypothetical protein [Kofleriaceae bacterium]